jgi:hypothetical protein
MIWINVSDSLPPECREVHVRHDAGVDLAMRYGTIWRLSSETTDSSEDELRGVVSWSEGSPYGWTYGWTGRKCGRCGGHGVDDENHTCLDCAGTGDEWGLMPGVTPKKDV